MDYSGIDIIKKETLSAHNFDENFINEIEQRIVDEDFGSINSLIIIHQDNLIYEKYYGVWSRSDLHYIASDTKSVASLLVGISKDKGKITSLDEKIYTIFSDYSIENLDERKKSISIEHLLTMSAGFEWDEWIPYSDPNNSNTQLKQSDDMIQYTINRPMANNPGTQFVYNSGASILLGGIIQRKTGKSVINFAIENLFNPLDISTFRWDSKNGITDCGGGLYMRPIDMAKIGYLVLNKGNWNNQQLISEEWLKASFENNIPAVNQFNYGFQWWNFETALDLIKDIGHASGHGDQYIFVIEELEMVIVLTGENYDNEKKFSAYDLLFEILKANPDYHKRVIDMGDWIKSINIVDYNYKGWEYLGIVYELISYSEYETAIDILDKLDENSNHDNWFYYYLYGKAYYELHDNEKAFYYLNKHAQSNNRSSLHEQAYYDLAMKMIEEINN
ncbi:MAG: serine hydrolase [Bacteroidales bacterium]|nr:serine hydrolase [Bacteroidales bacterium]